MKAETVKFQTYIVIIGHLYWFARLYT